MEGSNIAPYSRSISGTAPGALDPRQPQRLLRHPASRLLFASFDPRTAFATPPDLSKLSLKDELNRPKRVVVEVGPNGKSSWRFVPRAKRDPGVVDEGQWPRVIEICGERVLCTEEQWEIYKLDPFYECVVHPEGVLTTIAPAPKSPTETKDDALFSKKRVFTEDYSRPSKRFRAGEPEPSPMEDDADEEPAPPPKRARSRSVTRDAKRLRPGLEKLRRQKTTQQRPEHQQDEENLPEAAASDHDDVMEDWVPPSYHPSDATKRGRGDSEAHTRETSPEVAGDAHDTSDRTHRTYERTKPSKRARTTSPLAGKRNVQSQHAMREKMKRAKLQAEAKARAQQRHAEFLRGAFGDAAPDVRYENGSTFTNGFTDGANATNGVHHNDDLPDLDEEDEDEVDELLSDDQDDEEAARQAAIEESRRKLAELEKDRPLWEEQARKRAQSEQVEAERIRVTAAQQETERRRQEQARRRQEEAMRRQEEARREEERRQREEEELRRQEEARRQQDAARRARQRRFAYGPWSTARALERYRTLADEFDRTKWTAETSPLTFEDVPWPVLHSPASGFTVEDVDWASVEAFFTAVRPSMRSQDFRTFVQKSHLRFHPDRWRSRGLLRAVVDETERECLDVAANTVAQALTPIWSELKGR